MIWLRRLLCLSLLTPCLSLVSPSPAYSQDPGFEDINGEESSGNPLYGYLGVAAIGGVAIVALCKTSRR